MRKKPYMRPESTVVPYYEPLMERNESSPWTDDNFAKEHDVFFDEGNDERETLWDFTPFEEESGTED